MLGQPAIRTGARSAPSPPQTQPSDALTVDSLESKSREEKRVSSCFILKYDIRGFIHSNCTVISAPCVPNVHRMHSIGALPHSLSSSTAKAEEQDRCLFVFPFPLRLIHTLTERMEQACITLLVLETREKKRHFSVWQRSFRDELSGWEMSPGAGLPLPSHDTGDKGSLCSLICCCKSGATLLKPQLHWAWPAPAVFPQTPTDLQSR